MGKHVDVLALGVTLRIVVPENTLVAAVRRAWSACLAPHPTDPVATVEMQAGAESADDVAAALEHLTQDVTVAAIDARAGDLLMFHAAAVADPSTGRAVVLVGPSGVGKTTAGRTLARGRHYVTDETVGITPDGEIVPYPKPLSLIRPGRAVKTQVSPEELGLVPAREPLSVAAVVLLSREKSVEGAVLEPVRTVPGVALLAEHVSYLMRLERPVTMLAQLLTHTGGLHRARYAEAEDLDTFVSDLLEDVNDRD